MHSGHHHHQQHEPTPLPPPTPRRGIRLGLAPVNIGTFVVVILPITIVIFIIGSIHGWAG